MEKKENKTLKCRYISSTEWEQVNNSEDNYFSNGVKITIDGQSTYCCSETIIQSIANHLNDGTLSFSNKCMKCEGKLIEYIFEDKQNNITTKIQIPTILTTDPRYPFIRNDIRKLDTLCNKTQTIRNMKITKEVIKKTGTAILSAATLAVSYAGTRKIITKLSEPAPSMEHYTYNQYYGNVMAEEDFNEKVENLRKSYEKTQEKYKKK